MNPGNKEHKKHMGKSYFEPCSKEALQKSNHTNYLSNQQIKKSFCPNVEVLDSDSEEVRNNKKLFLKNF